ncbi:hypothetical protein AURDEDRAFT_167881 [Auricularia subglabra TFB-10046 SS5]|nr:hypothetical protein AURDEDRAFT_167881 [Auricularia subglabra TFB-10046 SS5]
MSVSEKAAPGASVRVQAATPPPLNAPAATSPSLKALANVATKATSPISSISKVAKLQTYLPTGTWITFTALQTLAFSLSPDVPPNGSRNCNTSQLLALSVFVGLSGIFALVAPFIKNFVLDATGAIAFPAPSGARVPERVRDNVTGAFFPYRTPEGHYVWPLIQAADKGDLVRDGEYVGIVVFDKKFEFSVASEKWWRRLFRSKTTSTPVDLVPRADNDAPSDPSFVAPRDNSIDSEIQDHVPLLTPHWSHVINKQQQYLAFTKQTFLHAFVSVSAFAALALMNTQVSGCFYPGLPDWVPVVVQVITLTVISGVAAFLVDDPNETTLPAPTVPEPDPTPASLQTFASGGGGAVLPNVVAPIPAALQPFTANIPTNLQALALMVIWVRAGASAVQSQSSLATNEGKIQPQPKAPSVPTLSQTPTRRAPAPQTAQAPDAQATIRATGPIPQASRVAPPGRSPQALS